MTFGEYPLMTYTARYTLLKLWPDAIERFPHGMLSTSKYETQPLAGARAVVENGSTSLRYRRGDASQDAILTIGGPGFEWPIRVKPHKTPEARLFAADVNAAASNLVKPAEPRPADDLVAKLEQLARLHEAGALSPEEFAAAKARLLFGEGDGDGRSVLV